jgi:hypothetical protein
MKKILKIFKVDTVSRLIIIFTVFGITGSLSVVVGDYLFNLFFPFSEGLFYWILRILIIFPAYQILLIIVGSIFGEFKYFWEMEKKILKRLKILKSSSS